MIEFTDVLKREHEVVEKYICCKEFIEPENKKSKRSLSLHGFILNCIQPTTTAT